MKIASEIMQLGVIIKHSVMDDHVRKRMQRSIDFTLQIDSEASSDTIESDNDHDNKKDDDIVEE